MERSDDAIAYGRREWDGVADGLSDEVKEAVLDYTRETPGPSGITYYDLNAALRAGTPYPAHLTDHIDAIDQAMAANPTSEDVMITRGMNVSHWPFEPKDAAGQTLEELAYMSTSLGGAADAFNGKDVVLHLRVPEGTPAMWVEEVSAFGAGERELLLGRGQEWTATRSVYIGDQWHVFGEVAS